MQAAGLEDVAGSGGSFPCRLPCRLGRGDHRKAQQDLHHLAEQAVLILGWRLEVALAQAVMRYEQSMRTGARLLLAVPSLRRSQVHSLLRSSRFFAES